MRGYRTIKYTLFIFCYFFWVVSAVLTAVGIYAKIAKEKDVVDTLTLDPALLLIIVGSVMFLITFLGCFGSLRNATCLLKTFLGILTAVLLLQIAAGVVGYLFTDRVMERTEKLMMKAIVLYREDQDLENAIDFIQKKFQCCGVESYKDWSHNVYFKCSDTNPSLEACGVPFSCCVQLQNQRCVVSSADGAEHHVWLRDAAAGGALGPSGRLHHRLPGENRLVGQKQPAAGRRADRRPAAARGVYDQSGCCSDLQDQQSPTTEERKLTQRHCREEGQLLVSSVC
ncbi:tetraspanin-33 isoform X1 [Sparus aurata]|uniref:tetraspanin-33 isoform X1 n=1 Tax=Sparus aurata TaxID=8175 RepID=UPI0011C1B558|nr:tetraspanin-33-like isoform X1 [Sparus aurata]